MENKPVDQNRELMIDGNGVAGLLRDVFSREMTPAPAECARCGKTSELGALLTFTQAPGMVLRCPACESVVLRIATTPEAIYLDARGAVYLRLAR